MSLRHAVLARRVAGGSLERADGSLAGDAPLKLLSDFFTAALFDRIHAAARDHAYDHEQDRQGFHLLILESERVIARSDVSIADCGIRNADLDQSRRLFYEDGHLQIRNPVLAIRTCMIEPELLLQGYRLGVFPMAMENDTIEWFSPDPRAILPLDAFHLPHALRRVARRKVFEIKIDHRLSQVIEACARREDTWINREIIESYTRLHELGYAHSVEAWREGKLAGGLYGVAIGGAFFGESMFHRITDASKIALLALVQHLRTRKFALLDTQWLTPHLRQFGGIEISRNHYLRLLRRAVELPRRF
jgi:leucyl/phenylalanyl-tRNA--protein transferase